MSHAGWKFYGWWGIVLPAFLIIWVTNALTLAGLNVFDAKLLAELGVERGPLKFGDTIQLLVSGALAPVGGWLADRYGVRPVMVAGVLLLAGGLYGYSFVDSLADVFGARSLGKILGGITVLDAAGGALGPRVTGMLFDATQSYQLGFGVIVALIAAALVAILMVRLPERAAH